MSASDSCRQFEPFSPASRMWKINRERIVLLAGPAAAVLQVAHPVVARGVANHSCFRTDATGRLRRTLDAVYTVAFGTVDEIEAVRRGVARAHQAVRGPGYSGFDPDAQLWVLSTLVLGSVTMYERFVAPLSDDDKDAFLEENDRFGSVFGLPSGSLPRTWAGFRNYVEEMFGGPLLGSEPVCGEVARAVIRPDAPFWMRQLSPVFRALALECIPSPVAGRLGLGASILRRPLWRMLELLLAGRLGMLPDSLRFAPHYLRARISRRIP